MLVFDAAFEGESFGAGDDDRFFRAVVERQGELVGEARLKGDVLVEDVEVGAALVVGGGEGAGRRWKEPLFFGSLFS